MALGALALVSLVGCAEEDPREQLLAERAAWSVEARNWVPIEGGINLALLVTAPTEATLDILTVRIRLYGAGERILDEQWLELDVADARPGVGRDVTVVIDTEAAVEAIEGLAVETVYDPGPEEAVHIRELRALED